MGEGNKRVSVSKYIGAEYILADVTRLLPAESEDSDLRVYNEYLKFYDVSGLFMIRMTMPGSYEKLAGFAGCNLNEKWPAETVDNVKTAYTYFSGEYEKVISGDDTGDLTIGDSFLIYITIFPLLTLLDESSSAIRSKIKSMRDELFDSSDEKNVSYISGPVEASLSGRIMRDIYYTAIFTVRPDMLNDTLKLSVDNPDVKFLNCSLSEAYIPG